VILDSVFRWIESSALSIWTRESPSIFAFPAILSAHAIGMALAAGVNAALALHLLGVAPAIPTQEMRRFAGVAWFGFWVNASSGVLLLIAYPTKALTNPLFYLKLALILAGMLIFVGLRHRLASEPQVVTGWTAAKRRWIGVASLVCWAGAIIAGRLLAYTYRHIFVGF
jgi:hypothetical protein